MDKKAVILAGGKGSRLAPYTTVLPKPLLPVGDRAILDVVVRQLQAYGFTDLDGSRPDVWRYELDGATDPAGYR